MAVLKEIWKYREVIGQFAWREVVVRYKQTCLGIAWAFLQPVSQMVIFTVIFSWFVRMPSEDYPYAIFVYSALLPWGLFSGGLTRAANSIVANAGLIQKIYLPREVFVITSLASPVIEFLLSALVYAGLMVVYRIPPSWCLLWLFPLFLLTLALILGAGLWLATINAFYRDVGSALGLVLQLWFYATPVVYPLSSVPRAFLPYYCWNPTVGIMEGFRSILLKGAMPDLALLGMASGVSIVLLISGQFLFRRAEGYFADVL
jgi:lipopolysaccharide transport system permease protein